MNRQLIIEGTVVDIRPIVTGTRADGTPWASQTYALQTDDGDGYSRLIAFDLYDETRIRQWNIQPGEHLAVAVTLSSTAAREGGYFTRLRAYKIMRGYEAINGLMALLGAQPQAPGTLAYTPATQPADLAQGLALLARLANTNRTPTRANQNAALTPITSPIASPAAPAPAQPMPAQGLPEGLPHYSVGQRPTLSGKQGLPEGLSQPTPSPAPASPTPSPTPASPTLPGMTPPPRRDGEDDLPF